MEALIYIGGAALAFAVFGGLGITIANVTIPKIPAWQRGISAVAGVLFIALGIVLFPEVRGILWGIPTPTATVSSIALENTYTPTSTLPLIHTGTSENLEKITSEEISDSNTLINTPPPAVTNTALPTSKLTSDATDKGVSVASDTPKPTNMAIQLVATPTPSMLGTLSVPANTSEGIKFDVPATGQYTFRYSGGSYSVYPANSIPVNTKTWLTAIRIFKNRDVEWTGSAISNFPDLSASDFGYSMTQSEAEANALGSDATISLEEGDYLILLAVDGRPYYSDNPGQVIFEVLFTSK